MSQNKYSSLLNTVGNINFLLTKLAKKEQILRKSVDFLNKMNSKPLNLCTLCFFSPQNMAFFALISLFVLYCPHLFVPLSLDHWHIPQWGASVTFVGKIYSVCCLIDIPKLGRRRSQRQTRRRSRYAWTLLVFSEGFDQAPGMWMSNRPRFLLFGQAFVI